MTKDFWILTSIEGPKLSRHKSWYYRLAWYNYTQHEMHYTDIDIKHRNYRTKGWKTIIERETVNSVFDSMRVHPTKTTQDRDPIVDGDSRPRWLCDLEVNQVETLVAHRQTEREEADCPQFNRLFDDGQ